MPGEGVGTSSFVFWVNLKKHGNDSFQQKPGVKSTPECCAFVLGSQGHEGNQLAIIFSVQSGLQHLLGPVVPVALRD